MIYCEPMGLFSWGFLLEGDGHRADLELNWFGEQGRITADGTCFDVRKHGVMSGFWTLDRDGTSVMSAQKSTPFTRTFELLCGDERLLLCAESVFGRSFRLERSGSVIAMISPNHPFTRHSTIRLFSQELDFATISFAFWLTVLAWRRARSNTAAAG